MENEYKDFIIMSPDQMEDIAKKYQEQLNKNNTLKEFACNNKICRLIEEIASATETLKLVCSKKFYNIYKDSIENTLKTLTNLYSNFSDRKIEIKKEYKSNFCTTLKTIIIKLSELIETCFITLRSKKDSKLEESILNCISLIKQTTNLFSDCKYRRF